MSKSRPSENNEEHAGLRADSAELRMVAGAFTPATHRGNLSGAMPLPRRLLCCCLSLIFGYLSASERISGSDARVSVEGRAHPLGDCVRLGYPGSTVRIQFSGTSLTALLHTQSSELFLDVSVDGGVPRFLQVPAGAQETVLFSGLPPARHHVEIVKRIEGDVALFDLCGFETDGKFEAPPPLPERRMLFIGDSFTCGQGADIRDGVPMHPSKAHRQNARLAYGTLLARRYGAQVHLVAVSGKGLLRDWQGLRTGVFPSEYYGRTLPDEPEARWDSKAYVPDLIGVCLGTNDFDEGIPDETDYVRAYAEFVRRLRADAPAAIILLIDSPVLKDALHATPKRSVLKAYLAKVIALLGDTRVVHAPIESYPVVPGDWHPNRAAHEAVAREIGAVIEQKLRWEPALVVGSKSP